MKDIIVFISPRNFEHEQIADLLRIHNIKTTHNIHEATVVLAKDKTIDISQVLSIPEDNIIEHIPHIKEPILLPEPNKKTHTKYQTQKNFNKVKQTIYKHTCFNRGHKR